MVTIVIEHYIIKIIYTLFGITLMKNLLNFENELIENRKS